MPPKKEQEAKSKTKALAKKTVKKAPVKKVEKKESSKKASIKKAPAKKESTRKTATKKAPAKKATTKKTATEKPTAAAKKKGLKLCVLGGCAKMAVPALRALADEPGVEKVFIADLDGDFAKALASELGDRFEGGAVDATNSAALTALVKDYDVALGYVGPFYLFEAPIAEACINAKTHYVSIADDFDSYLAVEKLHDKAKKAGVTIISGLGNSPGITNILSRKGYESMDSPVRIHVNWTGGSDEEVGPANLKHVMHIFEGKTLQWMYGGPVWVKTGRGEKVVQFPEPIGMQTVFYTGHAESVSLPKNLPGLEEVTLHGGIQPTWAARFARVCGDLGLTTSHKKREFLAKVFTPILGVFTVGGSADKSVFRIDVHGSHKGQPRHHVYTGVGHIADITSLPLVEGALMVGRGEVKSRGVFAAEAALNPDEFLPRLEKRGIQLNYYEGGFGS